MILFYLFIFGSVGSSVAAWDFLCGMHASFWVASFGEHGLFAPELRSQAPQL